MFLFLLLTNSAKTNNLILISVCVCVFVCGTCFSRLDFIKRNARSQGRHVVSSKTLRPTAPRVVVPACPPRPQPSCYVKYSSPHTLHDTSGFKNYNSPHLQRSRQISLSDISLCYPRVSPSMWGFNVEKFCVFVF